MHEWLLRGPLVISLNFIMEVLLILVESNSELDIEWFFNVQFVKKKWSLRDSVKVFVE